MKKDGGKYVGLGLVFGVVVGVLTDHVGLGVAFGLIAGAILSMLKARRGDVPKGRN